MRRLINNFSPFRRPLVGGFTLLAVSINKADGTKSSTPNIITTPETEALSGNRTRYLWLYEIATRMPWHVSERKWVGNKLVYHGWDRYFNIDGTKNQESFSCEGELKASARWIDGSIYTLKIGDRILVFDEKGNYKETEKFNEIKRKPEFKYIEDDAKYVRELGWRNIMRQHCKCPSRPITLWKACKTGDGTETYVELEVELEQKVVEVKNSDKLRTRRAKVVSIKDKNGNSHPVAYSFVYGKKLKYRQGEMVEADGLNENDKEKNGAGINAHFWREDCKQWFK